MAKDVPLEIPEAIGESIDADEGWELDVDFDDEASAAEAVMAGDESDLPPERVRFFAPVVLRPEGGEDLIDGAIHNLSARGVALVCPWQPSPGERVWIQFRLQLAEDPIDLLCEVIWCHPRGEDEYALGLHFASLTRDEERRVCSVVAERSEGRAGEWPLPVLPHSQTARVQRSTHPWLSAAAGMAAGIALALLLSVIPTTGVSAPEEQAGVDRGQEGSRLQRDTDREPTLTEPTTSARAERLSAPAPVAPAEPRVESATSARAERRAAPAPVAPAEPGAESATSARAERLSAPAPVAPVEPRLAVPARAPSGQLREQPAAKTPAARDTGRLPQLAEQQAAADTQSDVLRPLGTADGVEIALLCDGPVADHVSFWLVSPRRLVIDVYGRESAFAQRSYRIEHPLASRLRIGQHPSKVRFVLETADQVSPQVKTRTAGNSLFVTLRAR